MNSKAISHTSNRKAMQFQVVLRTPINQDPTNYNRWEILPDFHSLAKYTERWRCWLARIFSGGANETCARPLSLDWPMKPKAIGSREVAT
jgi:hypothetical protein